MIKNEWLVLADKIKRTVARHKLECSVEWEGDIFIVRIWPKRPSRPTGGG